MQRAQRQAGRCDDVEWHLDEKTVFQTWCAPPWWRIEAHQPSHRLALCGAIHITMTIESPLMSSSPHSGLRHITPPYLACRFPASPSLWVARDPGPPGEPRAVPRAAPAAGEPHTACVS